MTYESIYRRICREVWGSSVPPPLAMDMLPDAGGLIAEEQRRVQQAYNYWFMQGSGYITSVASQQDYDLPDDFREMIEGQWKVYGETFYKGISSPIALGDARKSLNPNIDTEEYPQYYEIKDETISFYNIPLNDGYEFHFDYWKFIDGPQYDAVFTDGIFTSWAGTDDVTLYAGLVIVYRVCSSLCRILDEAEKSDRFRALAAEEEELLRKEDRARRQNILRQTKKKDY